MIFIAQKLVDRKNKRLGRGHGSGKVKTSGRGTKGQNARGTMRPGFEGGQLPLTKRLPFLRGKLRNNSMQEKPFALSIVALQKLPAKTVVTKKFVIEKGMVGKNHNRIKIVGKDTLSVALTVELPCSSGAKAAIEKAGGTVKAIE